MILAFIIWQFYCDERNRRKFYEDKYYKEPRIHHYPNNKKPWLIRIFFSMMIISMISCEKETAIALPTCYKCEMEINSKITNIDTCMDADAFIKKYGYRLELICREVK